jgi:hypothetical protein
MQKVVFLRGAKQRKQKQAKWPAGGLRAIPVVTLKPSAELVRAFA